jgi:pyruvate/2-oxoglutarate dehydrogenase complex dihydrolipoamide acyltransferase (E2) component
MSNEFKLPELGENIESADIIKVHIKPGDKVELDQVVLEIETDKANVEVPSEIEGIVDNVNVSEGSSAKVGEVVFTVKGGSAKSEPVAEVKEEKVEEPVTPKPEQEKKVEQAKPVEKKQSGGMYEFKVPELGENIDSAQITKVLVKVGDKVKVDEVLLEIETDKATVEVPSEVAGIVKEVKINDGDTAKVGQTVIVFDAETLPDRPLKNLKLPQRRKNPKLVNKQRKRFHAHLKNQPNSLKLKRNTLAEMIYQKKSSRLLQVFADSLVKLALIFIRFRAVGQAVEFLRKMLKHSLKM